MIVMILTVMFINISYVYSGNSKCYLYQNDFLTWESQYIDNSSTVMTAYT